MTRLDYQNICSAVTGGEEKQLLNSRSHQVGRILPCHSDYFNVEVNDGWQVWSMQECEEHGAPAATVGRGEFQI
ncbi:c-type cytochrome [Desulfuromonas versatilis]|uniref:C-type cytochrome n=1 Tax=Desulfuromonas versatilis TaxID=2802975 RepID=A0ABM8I1M0_9BACT|nr:hypothetical protein [Desulfuromonas versatilis]BCR06779.1 c-type cytochrome [Desulfuromonas versatilis]